MNDLENKINNYTQKTINKSNDNEKRIIDIESNLNQLYKLEKEYF